MKCVDFRLLEKDTLEVVKLRDCGLWQNVQFRASVLCIGESSSIEVLDLSENMLDEAITTKLLTLVGSQIKSIGLSYAEIDPNSLSNVLRCTNIQALDISIL